MKTVYVLKSEIDDTLIINCTDNLEKTLKPYQKIKKIGKMEICLWELLCHIEFEDDKRSHNFMQFLQSDAGKEFIMWHFARNPLLELQKLTPMLPKALSFYVIGGLAIDGYMGNLSRMHNDADLLCWRKDIETVKNALKKLGYKTKSHYLIDNPKKVHYLETDEENPIISFVIMDELPNNCFEISIGKNIHQVFPKKYLNSKKATINDIKFPVVGLELLDFLNKKTKANLDNIQRDNPQLYSVLGCKINNNRHDRKLLNKLMKK